MEITQKIEREQAYDIRIPFLGIYLKKMKILIWKDTQILIFKLLFTIVKTQVKATQVPSNRWLAWEHVVCAYI